MMTSTSPASHPNHGQSGESGLQVEVWGADLELKIGIGSANEAHLTREGKGVGEREGERESERRRL